MSKQTLKGFNFRGSLLSTVKTNASKGRNEDGGGEVWVTNKKQVEHHDTKLTASLFKKEKISDV